MSLDLLAESGLGLPAEKSLDLLTESGLGLPAERGLGLPTKGGPWDASRNEP